MKPRTNPCLRETISQSEEERMQSQHLQPSWPLLHTYNYSFDHAGIYDFAMDTSILDQHDFSPSFTTEDDSGISFDSYFATTMDPDTLVDFPSFELAAEAVTTQSIMDGIQPISSGIIGEVCDWMDESDSDDHISSQLTSEADVWSPCPVLEQGKSSAAVSPSNHMTSDLPGRNVESDNLLVLHHLLTAYGEATQNGHNDLSEVIVKRINEIINPFGQPLERVAFNLFQNTENQGGYLRQQSSKNFESAFKAFYQCFPYGRFAHFAANSTILQAIPNVAESVHIVDFDMGEGIQWPPMIEAIARLGKKLRLTSIRSEDEGCTTEWTFEKTKQRLCGHARSLGLSIEVEEITMDNLRSEIERTKKAGGGFREVVAFNCMVGLPHMGRRRTRTQVAEFLKMAKEILANCTSYKGIIAFGDGEAQDYSTTCPGYASSFNSQLIHYQALFESMEHNFPVYLSEARIAMESLFVAPYICSNSWFQQWELTGESQSIAGCTNWRIGKDNLLEAQELVNEKETSYKVKIRGESENEMVLEWQGIPLVRVSIWV